MLWNIFKALVALVCLYMGAVSFMHLGVEVNYGTFTTDYLLFGTAFGTFWLLVACVICYRIGRYRSQPDMEADEVDLEETAT